MSAKPSASETLKLIGEIHRAFARRVDAPLRDMGFALAQLPVLFTLNRQQPLSQAELARLIRVEQSTMAQLLNRWSVMASSSACRTRPTGAAA